MSVSSTSLPAGSSAQSTSVVSTPSVTTTAKSQPVQSASKSVASNSSVRSHSSNDSVRQSRHTVQPIGAKRNLNNAMASAIPAKETSASASNEVKHTSGSPTLPNKPATERNSPDVGRVFTPATSESGDTQAPAWCKSPVNNGSTSAVNNPSSISPMTKASVEVSVPEEIKAPAFNRAYVSPGSFSTTSTSSLCSANTVPLNIVTNPMVQNSNFTPMGNVRSAPCTPPISQLSSRVNKFDPSPRIMSSPGSAFDPAPQRQFQDFESTKNFNEFQSMSNMYDQEQNKMSGLLYGSNRVLDNNLPDSDNMFRNNSGRQPFSQMQHQQQPPQQQQPNIAQKALMDYFRTSNAPSLPMYQEQPSQKMATNNFSAEMSRRNMPQFANQGFGAGNGFTQNKNNTFDNSRFMMNPTQSSQLGSDLTNPVFVPNNFGSNNPMRMMPNSSNFSMSHPQQQQPPSSVRNTDSFNNRFHSYQRPQETPSNNDRNGAAAAPMFSPSLMQASSGGFDTMQDDLQRGKIVPIGAERAKKQSTFSQPSFAPNNEPNMKSWDLGFDSFVPSTNNPLNQSSSSSSSTNYFGFEGSNSNGLDLFGQFPQSSSSNFGDQMSQSSRGQSTWGSNPIIPPVDSFFNEPSQLNRMNGHSFMNGVGDSEYYSSSSSGSVNKPMQNNPGGMPPHGLNQFGFKNERSGWNN